MKYVANLVLASGSPRRRELMTTLDIPFTVEASQVDETITETMTPGDYVVTLAARKSQEIARRHSEGDELTLVIGADTVVVLDGEILGKPTAPEHAVEMLQRLQGRTHEVYTGLCVVRSSDLQVVKGFSKTKVTMRPLSTEQIKHYVASGEPMDKAGSYAIQGIGSMLITEIEGDYFTVVGLPMYLLCQYLEQFRVSLLS